MKLRALDSFVKIFYTFERKNFPGEMAEKYMENLK